MSVPSVHHASSQTTRRGGDPGAAAPPLSTTTVGQPVPSGMGLAGSPTEASGPSLLARSAQDLRSHLGQLVDKACAKHGRPLPATERDHLLDALALSLRGSRRASDYLSLVDVLPAQSGSEGIAPDDLRAVARRVFAERVPLAWTPGEIGLVLDALLASEGRQGLSVPALKALLDEGMAAARRGSDPQTLSQRLDLLFGHVLRTVTPGPQGGGDSKHALATPVAAVAPRMRDLMRHAFKLLCELPESRQTQALFIALWEKTVPACEELSFIDYVNELTADCPMISAVFGELVGMRLGYGFVRSPGQALSEHVQLVTAWMPRLPAGGAPKMLAHFLSQLSKEPPPLLRQAWVLAMTGLVRHMPSLSRDDVRLCVNLIAQDAVANACMLDVMRAAMAELPSVWESADVPQICAALIALGGALATAAAKSAQARSSHLALLLEPAHTKGLPAPMLQQLWSGFVRTWEPTLNAAQLRDFVRSALHAGFERPRLPWVVGGLVNGLCIANTGPKHLPMVLSELRSIEAMRTPQGAVLSVAAMTGVRFPRAYLDALKQIGPEGKSAASHKAQAPSDVDQILALAPELMSAPFRCVRDGGLAPAQQQEQLIAILQILCATMPLSFAGLHAELIQAASSRKHAALVQAGLAGLYEIGARMCSATQFRAARDVLHKEAVRAQGSAPDAATAGRHLKALYDALLRSRNASLWALTTHASQADRTHEAALAAGQRGFLEEELRFLRVAAKEPPAALTPVIALLEQRLHALGGPPPASSKAAPDRSESKERAPVDSKAAPSVPLLLDATAIGDELFGASGTCAIKDVGRRLRKMMGARVPVDAKTAKEAAQSTSTTSSGAYGAFVRDALEALFARAGDVALETSVDRAQLQRLFQKLMKAVEEHAVAPADTKAHLEAMYQRITSPNTPLSPQARQCAYLAYFDRNWPSARAALANIYRLREQSPALDPSLRSVQFEPVASACAKAGVDPVDRAAFDQTLDSGSRAMSADDIDALIEQACLAPAKGE